MKGKIYLIKKAPQTFLRGFFAVRTGLEPATSAVTGRHSNQLNYRTRFKSRGKDKIKFSGLGALSKKTIVVFDFRLKKRPLHFKYPDVFHFFPIFDRYLTGI